MNGITTIASVYLEQAKAKIMGATGRFFGLREQLLSLRDRADKLERRATSAADAALESVARNLRSQVDAAYDQQQVLEARVGSALSQLKAMQEGGASATSVASTASALLSAAGQVAVHTKRVDVLKRTIDSVERKTYSPAELARGGGFGMGSGTLIVAGLVVVGGIWFLRGRRR